MRGFNPYNFSQNTEGSASIDVSDQVFEKGHKNILQVDLQKFEETCKKFREKKDIKISKLSKEDKDSFDLAVKYVHLLYGTEHYARLYDIVKRTFKNVGALRHNTVGAYFAGCLNNKNGCSLSCAGSMPVPKNEEGWNSCDKAVILAERKEGKENSYSFTILKAAEKEEDMNPAYLFVESTEFDGLDTSEKVYLKSMGCKKLKVVSYSEDMSYSDYGEPISIDDIKERKYVSSEAPSSDSFESDNRSENNKNKNHRNYKNNDGGWNWLMWSLIIFIILLVLFILYAYYKIQKLK